MNVSSDALGVKICLPFFSLYRCCWNLIEWRPKIGLLHELVRQKRMVKVSRTNWKKVKSGNEFFYFSFNPKRREDKMRFSNAINIFNQNLMRRREDLEKEWWWKEFVARWLNFTYFFREKIEKRENIHHQLGEEGQGVNEVWGGIKFVNLLVFWWENFYSFLSF